MTGGTQPRWRRDGPELFYFAPDRKLMAVEMSTGAQVQPLSTHPLFTAPIILIPADTQRYDVSAVLNWTARFTRQVIKSSAATAAVT